mmetsp:Transcript_1600/g.1793  ORF Transcript_1600/g.1793 Transcript_1600/m.1793 type:complete len:310 (-) Transcript_1600:121-1050(-)
MEKETSKSDVSDASSMHGSTKSDTEESLIIDMNTNSECPICCLEPENGLISLTCDHNYCNECLSVFVRIKYREDNVLDIPCPDPTCKHLLTNEEVAPYLGEQENRKFKMKRKRQHMRTNPDCKWCPECDMENLKVDNERDIECAYCETSYCFQCGLKSHPGEPCDADEMFEQYASEMNIKKCPKCGLATQKNSGCNSMDCKRCGAEWCWVCGDEITDPFTHYRKGACKGKSGHSSGEWIGIWSVAICILCVGIICLPVTIIAIIVYACCCAKKKPARKPLWSADDDTVIIDTEAIQENLPHVETRVETL